MVVADHGGVDDADAGGGAVRAGAVGEPEGDGGAEARVPRLRPADRRTHRVHAGLQRRRPHHRRRGIVLGLENTGALDQIICLVRVYSTLTVRACISLQWT